MSACIHYECLDNECPTSVFAQLARLHAEGISEGFLSTLGERFLQRLHHALAMSPNAFVIAAIHENEVVGFVCGSTDTKKVYRACLLRLGVVTAPVILPKLISLKRLRRVLETLLYPARTKGASLPRAELLSLCVASAWQRKGIGRRLFDELVSQFGRREVGSFRIVTGANLQKARKFYESMGARMAGEINVHRGEPSLVYIHEIGEHQ